MPFDPILGVGRSPKYIPVVTAYQSKETSTGMASAVAFPDPNNTRTVTIDSNQRIFSVQVHMNPTSSGLSVDSALFKIFIDNKPIASYVLPNSDAWSSNIDEYIPVDIVTTGASSMVVQWGPENADATGYNFGFSVTAFGIPV